MPFSPTESKTIETLVANVESRTGVQVVVAAIEKADNYIELPWKAFALGASIAALATVLADLWRPQWVTSETVLVSAFIILGAASACAVLAIFVPPFARLFLRATHSHLEVQQYARSLFLTRALFRTRSRTAVLILVSGFERRIEILPDVGLHDRVTEAEWRRVVDVMTVRLRDSRLVQAVQEGLAAVEQLLASKGFRGGPTATNDLPDRPIDERGA